jgi:C-terminal processing protease CtpA/Prc
VPIGAQVESVVAGGPAARAGIRRGDLIVAFEGERVEFPEQLARWVTATPPGTAVTLVWVRSDEEQSGRITLAESPSAVPEWAMQTPDAGGDQTRVADLQRRIRELNRQLEKLKDRPRR